MTTRSNTATVLTILNLKGGVGKTHTAWLMASVCQERGQRVLLVDTDTQGNLTGSFLPEADGRPGVEDVFNPAAECDAADLIRQTAFSHIDLIPAGPALAPFDLSEQTEWEKADLHLALVEVVAGLQHEYDRIVFDCPPRLSLVSFAALCASTGVVIPMEAADWGAQGIVQVSQAVEYVQGHYNANLQLLGYLVSRFKRARAYQQTYLKELRAHFGALAFDTVIPDLARFEQSVTDRILITQFAPKSREAQLARNLADEIQARSEGKPRQRRGRRRSGIRSETVPAA